MKKTNNAMFRNFDKVYKFKKMLNSNLSISKIAQIAHEKNSSFSRSYYEKILHGERIGTKEIWGIIFEALELKPIEMFLINPSWMIRQISSDWETYGSNKPIYAYVTEYGGMNVFFYYEIIGEKNKPNIVQVENYMKIPCRLIDMYTFLINQNKGSYILEDNDLPNELIEYERAIRMIQSEIWDQK